MVSNSEEVLTKIEKNQQLEECESQTPFLVCLVGSKGAHEAIAAFFTQMQTGHKLAFIILIQDDGVEARALDEMLEKLSNFRFFQAANGLKIQAECIYRVLPTQRCSLREGVLQVGAGFSTSIDSLLVKLASDQQDRAVVIFLSGSGNLGLRGIRAISEQGGLILAQDPHTALCKDILHHVITSQLVDFVARPEKMPQHILRWINHRGKLEAPLDVAVGQSHEIQEILNILRYHSGHDFSQYKKNTICRRLERRMINLHLDTIKDYVRYLERDSEERDNLLKEVLIGVTNFFRDHLAFEALKSTILPHIFKNVMSQNLLRIWVPGCSTGEEAYSLAMAVHETMAVTGQKIELRIFATDIDKTAVDFAREGRYPKSISSDVSPDRLENFFVEGIEDYRIRKEIKDSIIFAHHNAVRDPPFSKVDMISCRNLMIYLEPVLQQKLLRIFHYALNANGILFMGSSETTGDSSGCFVPFERKWKFFERKNAATFPSRRSLDFDTPYQSMTVPVERPRTFMQTPRKPSIRDISQEALLSVFAPPSVICDVTGDILYIHGRISNYIEPAPGEARLNIYAMAKDAIKLELSRGMQRVLATSEVVSFTNIPFDSMGEARALDMIIRPIVKDTFQQRLLIITFDEKASRAEASAHVINMERVDPTEHAHNIERELIFTREYMQNLVEQLETSNEELKSLNEELQSSNEELQSSNEELETAKEELQAVNEELVTLNAELQAKLEELSITNSDLDNFLASSSIATIFLNRYFLITRYTRSTTKIFNLIPSDIGRSLGDIASQMKYDRVMEDAEEVLNTLAPLERLVELRDGRILAMRITPYKTVKNHIDGVVISFTDITEQRLLEQTASMFRDIIDKSPSITLVLDKEEKIVYANDAFAGLVGSDKANVLGRLPQEIGLQLTGPKVLAEIEQSSDETKDIWHGEIELKGPRDHAIKAKAIAAKVPSKQFRYIIVLTHRS